MKSNYRVVVFLICLGLSLITEAQKPMGLSEAISLGMANNYQVKVAVNEADMAQNNKALGVGGFLPGVSANASYTENRNTTRQERYDGTVNEKDNALSTTKTANLTVAWVLFDGMKMFLDNQRYRLLGEFGQLQLRETIENTVAEIITGYFALVQQQKGIDVAREALGYSTQRLHLAQTRFRLGSASETEVLQARIDANSDSATVVELQNALANAKADLCLLIGPGTDTDFVPSDTVIVTQSLLLADLLEKSLQSNSILRMGDIDQQVAAVQRRLANSPKYPKLTFNAVYAGSLAEAEVGLLKSNRNYGPSVGVSLSYPVFDGFKTSTQAKNTRLQFQNAQLKQAHALEQIKTELLKLYNDYQNQKLQLDVAGANLKLSERNTRLAWERYRLGQISDLDFRQVQYIQSQTESRYLTTQWKCKQIETELLRLSGGLVQP
ncbi:MAG: TolC family protein [Breznakibacter sp.]